jgi:2-polyprenyl-6-methoxyphenol hydroxylase-like FAD-dependent oxidoreductase
MKILIIGAGITGNALAFFLSTPSLSHNITIIERSPSLRASGLQIDLRGHGIEVLKRMGLEEAFRRHAVPEQGFQIVDSAGRRRAFFPANGKVGEGKETQNFTTDYEIMRGDLCRLMYNAVKDKARYIFGTTIESFTEEEDSVLVHFTNGTTDRFDLLLGADGTGSHTRKQLFGPDGFVPFKGMYTAYFTMPRPIQAGETCLATMYIAPGRRLVMTRRHTADAIQVYIGYTDAHLLEKTSQDAEAEKKMLGEVFQGAGWETGKILEAMKTAEDFYGVRIGLMRLKSWFRGRVALVGDAAYCPSVNTGMGTTCGVVGAYVLAGEIGRHCGRSEQGNAGGSDHRKDDLTAALQAYETRFQPFMTQVQKGIGEDSQWRVWSTPFGIGILHCLLGVASLLKFNVGKWMLKENVKGWEFPDYEELRRE